ncbi:MAG: 50S ribosomal protein L4 [Chloroflexia bacterium]|nr:50S ribosomal protein L4 [Chloroflexia bacterium]
MQTPVYDMTGVQVDTVDLDPYIFGIEPNLAVMHQALRRQLANARRGTHETQERAEVQASTRKVWRQKGTGRARQGSRRAPHWKGGAVVFGPHSRSYRQDMPRKMRRLAVRSALSLKWDEGQVVLLHELSLDEIRTKAMVGLLERFGLDGVKTLLVLPDRDERVQLSARNIPGLKTLLAPYLNVVDLLDYDVVMMPLTSLEVVGQILGKPEA